jgi:hypothetical protein
LGGWVKGKPHICFELWFISHTAHPTNELPIALDNDCELYVTPRILGLAIYDVD